MRARAIGVMPMRDEKGQDDKIIAVHVDDAEYRSLHDTSDLPDYRTLQLQRFFIDYKVLEGKEVVVDKLQGAAEARAVIRQAVTDYAQNRRELIAETRAPFAG
jgi:inorganic pyrophosphatase